MKLSMFANRNFATPLGLYLMALSSLLFFSIGAYTQNIIWALIPFIATGVAVAFFNWQYFYYLMLFSLPLCTNIEIGSFSLDMPTEPLLIALVFFIGISFYFNKKLVTKKLFNHPIVQIIVLLYIWYIVVAIFSTIPLVSFKFLIAKLWFIIPFLFITPLIIRSVTDFKKLFWIIYWPLLFTIIYTLIRHGISGFSFDSVNHTPAPFYKNHVDYACVISIFYPFLFAASNWYKRGDFLRILLQISKVLFIFAMFVSYTRTAWLAIIVGFVFYLIIKYKQLKLFLLLGLSAIILFVAFLLQNNRYLQFAPDFNKTIYHHNLSDHLASTQTLNDVSSAERLYRWVAAVQMFKDKPLMGFGQGGFVHNYKKYTVSAFTTYVSGNIENSTVHNYILFILVEQGLIGLLLFILLCVTVLLYGQKIYHQTKNYEEASIIMAVIISFVIILFDNSLSDLIEAIKIGAFFYLCISLIIIQDLKNRNNLLA
jgi:O-antigen ligase